MTLLRPKTTLVCSDSDSIGVNVAERRIHNKDVQLVCTQDDEEFNVPNFQALCMDCPPPYSLICGNWSSQRPGCGKKGTKACGNCKLVGYCGTKCQQAHWIEHKVDCKCSMSKENWRPTWEREGRDPAWATGTASRNWHNTFGGSKYLWGNTPAFDIMKLEENEGLEYPDDFALLFAASGDLRHVVKTIANFPHGISPQITITINDRDFDVVARNAILLLLVLATDDVGTRDISDTVDLLIHLWYSAFIPVTALSRLHTNVKPLIDEVCERITDGSPNAVLQKSWDFQHGCTLRLVLTEKDWLRLQTVLDMPDEMSQERAAQIRKAVTLAPERKDYRERWHFKEASPFLRIAKRRFQEDGLLLPFGHPRTAFSIPNPTFFYSGKWSMDDKADPGAGWHVMDIAETAWPAKWDWYGKLYRHVFENIEEFVRRLQKSSFRFNLYNLDVQELPAQLKTGSYCRIEAANICDGGYVGIRKTFSLLSPLLQPRSKNPYASYIAIFINAVKEAVKMGDDEAETPDFKTLAKYLPIKNIFSLMNNNNADTLRLWDARDLALDVNEFFRRYMTIHDFRQISADLQIEMKEVNTIADRWPTQLRLHEGQDGAVEEFRLKLGSPVTNIECCVEWRRMD